MNIATPLWYLNQYHLFLPTQTNQFASSLDNCIFDLNQLDTFNPPYNYQRL